MCGTQTRIGKFGIEELFLVIFSIVLITDIAIFLDIPFLRQFFGFVFITFLPGLLILQILKLNKIGSTEKIVLSVGLSISFAMFFGLLMNNSLLAIGYETPLATISLLISFNIAFIALAIAGYMINKEQIFSLPNLNLSMPEKAFLIVPILFPALSIFGMYIMNATDSNIILMSLLFLIPVYIIFVCFFNQKFPKRLYPVVIFLIGLSLLLLLSLRSNHLIGSDVHKEYYFFCTTLNNLHWSVSRYSVLEACLSITLLPTIYQSILNIRPEFLFKILYSLIYSLSPVVIYVISKKYVEDSYAFLASCFFMFQGIFLWTAANARTNIAIFFFALTMMILFSDKIDHVNKKILFIVFLASCIVSHYSTAYIFFFIIFCTFVGTEILSKIYRFKKGVSLTLVVIFFAFIFFWYSQVTGSVFKRGIYFVRDMFSNLTEFFILETRAEGIKTLIGADIMARGIPDKIHFVFTWMTFVLIGIGIITLISRYKEMSFPELKFEKSEFLREKFEVEYFVIALLCAGLLVVIVALPFISVGYSLFRTFSVAITILSVFFVIGGIILSKHLILFTKREPVLKGRQKSFNKISNIPRNKGDNNSQAYLIILLVLIPYFLGVTGVTYQMFGYQRSIILNSAGEEYNFHFVHDPECYSAKWLTDEGATAKWLTDERAIIRADWGGPTRLISQGGIILAYYDKLLIEDQKAIKKGYVYLRYYNVVEGKLLDKEGVLHNITEYKGKFGNNCKIYDNGGSEIWE